MKIPYHETYLTQYENRYIQQAIESRQLSGDGVFTKECQALIKAKTQTDLALLTPSCTAALELAAILIDLQHGDEVIIPSFTFTSTANAFALRGAQLVFAEINPQTLNICARSIEQLITNKTKAIIPVHYAGIACDMDEIVQIGKEHGIPIIEDAAQAYNSYYRDQHLGTFGAIGAISFHNTKNISAGEGGAILINDPNLQDRAEIIREKGTNRKKFLLGQVDKYTWCNIGTSCLPSEITAAFLKAQLEHADSITEKRLRIWNKYHQNLETAELNGWLTRPYSPIEAKHNAHIYYILLRNKVTRDKCIHHLAQHNISAPFHYIPLHISEAAKKLEARYQNLPITEKISETIIRLPLWPHLPDETQDYVISILLEFLRKNN